MSSVTAVRRAAKAERAAEQAREEGERAWRSAWWVTSLTLAELPDAEGIKAAGEVLGQSQSWLRSRRKCGAWFKNLENRSPSELIPRFAVAAANAKIEPQLAADLIIQAEHEDCGLRAFNEMLTGQPWTRAAEDMTPDQRLHVARTELKRRPDEVLADEEVAEAVAEADRAKHISRAGLAHVAEENEGRLQNFDRNASKRFGLPEIPVQHLDGALREIVAGIAAVDIHGLEDEAAWDDRCDRLIQAATTAKKKPHTKGNDVWTPADQALLDELGRA